MNLSEAGGGASDAGPECVQLWFGDPRILEGEGHREALSSVLSEEERARHDRFMFAKDRDLFLAAHGLLRFVLARRVDVAARELLFVVNAYGRPELLLGQGRREVRFNLSHTQGLVALAVASSRDVGVDVECMRDVNLGVADRYFAAEEVAALQSLPLDRRRDRFYSYWTLKESYIKARGMGLALPLDGFAFDLSQGSDLGFRARHDVDAEPSRWRFALFAPTDEHRAALAFETPGPLRWRAYRWHGPLEPHEGLEVAVLASSAGGGALSS
jgi:4'-phosphopantetheinyl transferase